MVSGRYCKMSRDSLPLLQARIPMFDWLHAPYSADGVRYTFGPCDLPPRSPVTCIVSYWVMAIIIIIVTGLLYGCPKLP